MIAKQIRNRLYCTSILIHKYDEYVEVNKPLKKHYNSNMCVDSVVSVSESEDESCLYDYSNSYAVSNLLLFYFWSYITL